MYEKINDNIEIDQNGVHLKIITSLRVEDLYLDTTFILGHIKFLVYSDFLFLFPFHFLYLIIMFG